MFILLNKLLNLSNPLLTITLIIGFVTTLFFLYKRNKKPKLKSWTQVGRVQKLVIYPLKSCKGVEVDEAVAAPVGFKSPELDYMRDRVFMIMSTDEAFQDPETVPKMASISTQVLNDSIGLTAPNRPPITVPIPEDVPDNRRKCKILTEKLMEVLDCGDEVAEWLNEYLGGLGHRLYYHHNVETQRFIPTPVHRRFNVPISAKGTFQYETSYMLMTQESLNALSAAVNFQLPYNSFRPNILVEGTKGAFAEEFWDIVKIGDNGPEFKYYMPCDRCGQINIDENAGTINRDAEPLKTLFKLQRQVGNTERVNKYCKGKAIMGIHLGLLENENPNSEHIVKTGDPVYAWL